MQTLLVLLSALLTPLAWTQSLVIRSVTVIDATGNPPQRDMTVVIDRDRIAAISPSKKAKIPKGAEVVDGAGKFLIPGLWDMHVHDATYPPPRSTWSNLLYLANGVVGVRDMRGPFDANAWRAQHAASDERAPAIYLGSPLFDGPKPLFPGSIAIANEAQGRDAVAQQKERGADFIKVYSFLPREAYFAIADEARKRGIPFVGHVPNGVRAAEASDAGQKSIEHLLQVAAGCSLQEETLIAQMSTLTPASTGPNLFLLGLSALESYDDAKAQALFARFLRNKTWQCPTLTATRSMSRLNDARSADDERLKYILKRGRSSWADAANRGLFKDMTAQGWEAIRRTLEEDKKLVGRLHRAGVSILAGTDSGELPYLFPGFSLHDELALLVESGMSPMSALQAATSNAAQFMGQLDRRGTIETGKIADLVILDMDPVADINNTRSIRAVVLNGQLITRVALDSMLTEANVLANQ
jgi:imidazolonepropionase-like amidohydrolase